MTVRTDEESAEERELRESRKQHEDALNGLQQAWREWRAAPAERKAEARLGIDRAQRLLDASRQRVDLAERIVRSALRRT